MKRLVITAILTLAATGYAATVQYFGYPDAKHLKDADRILVYQNSSGSKNITGQRLKEQVNNNPIFKSATSATIPRTYMYFRKSDGALIVTPVKP